MKKTTITSFVIISAVALLISSCSRGITIYEAANGKAKCGRYIK